MNGPTRWRDDPGFEAATGLHIADEAATLATHDLARLRRRVVERAARGARPRVDPTAQPGALNVVLTALGLLMTAGVVGMSGSDPTPPAVRVATVALERLDLRTLGAPSVRVATHDHDVAGFCPAAPRDLATHRPPAESAASTRTQRQTRGKRVLLPRLADGSLGVMATSRLRLNFSFPDMTPAYDARSRPARLAKDLLPALLQTARFKVFK